jgi:predicted transcriptional regulator
MKVTTSDRMRQLLREDDWTPTELASEVGCHRSMAQNLIGKEIAAGNVQFVSYDRRPGSRSNLYTWVGDDDLLTMAKRAADYLEEHAKDQLGQSIANHLRRMTS